MHFPIGRLIALITKGDLLCMTSRFDDARHGVQRQVSDVPARPAQRLVLSPRRYQGRRQQVHPRDSRQGRLS